MNKTLAHTNFWDYKDKKYKFDIYLTDSFDSLKPITQVYGIMLNETKDKIMVVYNKGDMWILPGGKVEENEKPLETLVREMHEETNCDVDLEQTTPLFYQEGFLFDSVNDKWLNQVGFQTRYITVVKKYRKFISDPDNGDIIETKWISFSEIPEYLKWGETALLIKKSLEEKY